MRRIGLALLAFLALAGAQAAPPPHRAPLPHWVASWSTPQQIPEERNALPPEALTGATLRQTVHLPLGGKTLWMHVSKVFGTEPLHPDTANEAVRQAVNARIRGKGHFDAAIDFDAALREGTNPAWLDPALDCGDHLHPNPKRYEAMAAAVPLSPFGVRLSK